MKRLFCFLILTCTCLCLLRNDSDVFAQEPETLQSLQSEVQLFNGKDLSGWHFYAGDDKAKVADAWSAQDGVIKCKGKPISYLQTNRWYRDYELELKWRWPGEKGGNSGVLVHSSTPLLFYGWPKSMEVQLQFGSAGDFWVIGEGVDVRVENEQDRRVKPVPGNQHSHRRIRRLAGKFEKPIGQWNHMKVICRGNEIEVFVNSKLVNKGTQMTVSQGGIGIQSEGTAVEFKDISLKPLNPEGDK